MSTAEEGVVSELVGLVLQRAGRCPQVRRHSVEDLLRLGLDEAVVVHSGASVAGYVREVAPTLDGGRRVPWDPMHGVSPALAGGLRDLRSPRYVKRVAELLDVHLAGVVLVDVIKDRGDLHVTDVRQNAREHLANLRSVERPASLEVCITEEVDRVDALLVASAGNLLDDGLPPHRILVQWIVPGPREDTVLPLHVPPAEELVPRLPILLLRGVVEALLLPQLPPHLRVRSPVQRGLRDHVRIEALAALRPRPRLPRALRNRPWPGRPCRRDAGRPASGSHLHH
mmetsp:Transcript_126192/g.353381  ORF Transcript_126192/g.353381 Transcript_126192/m.353381 type:complete len:284 (-) Transcript_126192:147-998(-)